MTRAGRDDAIRQAIVLVSEHPGIDQVDAPLTDVKSCVTAVHVTFRVNLPSERRRQGKSPSGVKSREVVRFDFPAGYPMYPPTLSLRENFPRNLPHMQPWTTDGRPVPCIFDGDPAELFHRDGLAGILNQTVLWLDSAALDKLIDPEHGWEPVRRDSVDDVVVADAGYLRRLVDRRGGWEFLGVRYLKNSVTDGTYSFLCQVLRKTVMATAVSAREHFFEDLDGDTGIRWGASLALVIWPGKLPSGQAIVSDRYFPETVENVADLKERATMYGCGKDLDDGMRYLGKCFRQTESRGTIPLPVILLARRPFHLIGDTSPIEILPYIVEVRMPGLFDRGATTAVRTAAHRYTISRPLLAEMAGRPSTTDQWHWTLVGAGSLGSKIALHLARTGSGPDVVVDQSRMSPHNFARHSLIPLAGKMQMFWMDAKARNLCQALRGLDQNATALVEDAVALAARRQGTKGAWSKSSWAVVNTTASIAVREAFGASQGIHSRVVETSLFAGGRLGVVTVEGAGRNPSTTDLMAEFYAILQAEPELSSIVFNDNEVMTRQGTGHGCGSLTMAMSDGRLSLFAAGMAEYLLGRQERGFSDEGGEILIGRLSDDGLGVAWRAIGVPPVTVIDTRDGPHWRVRIHQRALSKIQAEVGCWPNVETGGVLMGRLSEASRVANAVDVLDAPEDSTRSANEFVLGKKGLRPRLEKYSTTVDWSLYCLGTWHSHLFPGGPSPTDRAAARAVSLTRQTPSIFLVRTPTDFTAFTGNSADRASSCSDGPEVTGQGPESRAILSTAEVPVNDRS